VSATHPDRGHLDAETLAAWIDGGLDTASVAAAEAHLSNCDGCQALVATTMKTLPADAAAPAGVRLWRWWLAPVAAATAAVVIWVVSPQQVIAPSPHPATVATPNVVPAPQAAAPRENAPAAPETPPAPRERQQEFAGASRRDASNEVRAQRQESDPKRADAPQFAPVPPPAAAPPPVAPRPAAPPAATAAADNAALRQEKPIDRAAELGAAAAPTAQMRARQAVAVEIATPDPSRRWRIVNGEQIERTDDNGATWRVIGSVNDVQLNAGSAPSSSVAWFAGNAGVVLLTTDGATLQRLRIGEPLDIAGVSATDARIAIVSTVDGRRFRTDDGGRTWRPF
jgi:hypothetical protein